MIVKENTPSCLCRSEEESNTYTGVVERMVNSSSAGTFARISAKVAVMDGCTRGVRR
jgi:hypothetical protein